MSPPAENALPDTGCHHRADVVVGGKHPPDGGERVVHFFVDGVERLGTVDAHHVDAAGLFDEQPRGELLVPGERGEFPMWSWGS